VHGKFNFEKVFDQYLRTTKIPIFSYSIDRNEKILTYQWKNCVVGFDLPIRFNYFGNEIFLRPIDYVPQKKSFANQSFDIDEFIKELERNYYIKAVEEHY
jgi:replication initiation and membrane attachment protein DnaB